MAEDTGTETSETEAPVQEPEEPDWKAKYEEALKHSRTWESRAKKNSEAASKVERLESKAEQDRQRIEELETYKTENEHKSERERLAAKVSQETGVPADIIAGDTEEDMKAWADRVFQYLHPKPKGLPNQGKTPERADKAEEHRQYVRALFSNKE